MRYQVPQFIEVEDKIFGPLTFKQFAYLAGAGGATVVLVLSLPLYLAIILALPIVGLGAALAFYKVHNRPFIGVMESAFRYALGSKLYLWKKRERKAERTDLGHTEDLSIHVPTISESKLKDLSWSLDIKESIYAGTKGEGRNRQ